ncbi:MAG: hypothetical protein OSB58_19505 [Alphaproteobacteria bacterium]|jgi:putative addiction module CopG family antidote|nr:hypothetical protein [Alphaproteobacteria bacterium]
MNVPLTSEQEAAIERLIKAGLFSSKEAAIARSHDWLTEEAAKLEALRADVQAGIDQADRGEAREVTADEIMLRVRARLEEENSANPVI